MCFHHQVRRQRNCSQGILEGNANPNPGPIPNLNPNPDPHSLERAEFRASKLAHANFNRSLLSSDTIIEDAEFNVFVPPKRKRGAGLQFDLAKELQGSSQRAASSWALRRIYGAGILGGNEDNGDGGDENADELDVEEEVGEEEAEGMDSTWEELSSELMSNSLGTVREAMKRVVPTISQVMPRLHPDVSFTLTLPSPSPLTSHLSPSPLCTLTLIHPHPYAP